MNSFKRILLCLLIVGCANIFLSQPGKTESPKYFCSEQNDLPTTFIRTPSGEVPLIRWVSHAFLPQDTPQERCNRASLGLQRAYDNNVLEYLRADEIDGQPVICAVGRKGEACTPETTIIYLVSGTNANEALALIFELRRIASVSPLYQTGGDLLTYVNGEAYSSLDAVVAGIVSIQFPDMISED